MDGDDHAASVAAPVTEPLSAPVAWSVALGLGALALAATLLGNVLILSQLSGFPRWPACSPPCTCCAP